MTKGTAHDLTVFSDLAELSRHAATTFAESAIENVASQGRFTACLSGGSTPRQTLALLAENEYAQRIPWQEVHIFWGDERCIPLTRPDNHYTMTSELLLGKIPIPSANVHRIRGEHHDPIEAAQGYEEMLRGFFRLGPEDLPRFDLVFLGMGADCHVASLFPGTVGLNETKRLAIAHYVPKLTSYRITLTFPVFNNAAHVICLTSGDAKAEALEKVLGEHSEDQDLPARLLAPHNGQLTWFVDRAAASRL